MSIRLAAFRLLKNGRFLIRHIHRAHQKKIASYKDSGDGGAQSARYTKVPLGKPSFVQHVTSQARRVVVDAVLNRVTHTLASDLRRKVTRRLLFGDSTPFFALVGVSLASGAGILTKDDELEAVCWEIREAVSRSVMQRLCGRGLVSEEMPEIGLSSLELGPPLAKGCNAVVYAARWRDEQGANGAAPSSTSVETSSEPPSLLEFPLAVKMMFNYDAESNAIAVLQAMHRETVPAWYRQQDVTEVLGTCDTLCTVSLPPHSNVVEMYRVFAAPVPQLPGSMSLYPDALPRRLNPEGSGRNMSLFLVMKRYECSLQKLLQSGRPSSRVSHLLLAQLLEALAHLSRNNVAHRDLKCDNLLLDWSRGEENIVCPILAVCDFGCCLADAQHGMQLPFHTHNTDRGGNAAHMPPEVAYAVPGAFSYINYSKADLWAAGTIAYELYGLPNPFSARYMLNRRTYQESDLPPLPDDVPAPLRALVTAMLSRNPAKRPTAELSASVCQLLLWAPSEWLQGSPPRNPSSSEMLQWLLSMATKVLCEGGYFSRGRRTLPEYQLISSLLARTSLQQLKQALAFIQNHIV